MTSAGASPWLVCVICQDVCRSAAEVSARSPHGCAGAHDAAPSSFFATRQSGPGCGQCATGASPQFVLDSLEQCDDGNQIGGDGCGPTCLDEGPAPTTGVPTTSVGDDDGSSITATESESESESPDSAGIDTDLADRGCACDQGAPDLPALGLGLLALLGLRRRRPR